jgi:hypothetical protein
MLVLPVMCAQEVDVALGLTHFALRPANVAPGVAAWWRQAQEFVAPPLNAQLLGMDADSFLGTRYMLRK